VAAGRARLQRVLATASAGQQGAQRATQCLAAARAALELYGDHPAIAFTELAAEVTSEDGAADFGAYLQEGDTDGALPGMGLGLLDAAAADVHLVVRDHGPAKPGMIVEQIQTFDDFCNPTCTDLQVSVQEAR
jgi:hypothetical protein